MSPEQALRPYGKPTVDDVLWFNVDPPDSTELGTSNIEPAQGIDLTSAPPRTAFEARVRHVADQLGEWCPGLDEEMVRDLLRQDIQPKVETYGDERDGVRSVSAVAVIARELPDPDDFDGVTEQLVFQMVEMVVGDGWIVTCWHPSRVFSGTSGRRRGPPRCVSRFSIKSSTDGWRTSTMAVPNVRSRPQATSASISPGRWSTPMARHIECSNGGCPPGSRTSTPRSRQPNGRRGPSG